MDTREVLEKTRAWIHAEIAKAERPYADKFDLTSLAFCVHKGAGPDCFEAGEVTIAALQAIVSAQNTPPESKRYDVFTPDEVLGLIKAALEQHLDT